MENASVTNFGEKKSESSTTSTAQGLDDHQKDTIRKALVDTAIKLLGIPYVYGAEVTDFTKIPTELDCSELVKYVYHVNGLRMVDGSQNQFNFTVHSPSPRAGDLAFFGRGAKIDQIYHVGMVLDTESIIEARAFDPTASFKTGEVITRPIKKWMDYKSFVGFRCSPKLL